MSSCPYGQVDVHYVEGLSPPFCPHAPSCCFSTPRLPCDGRKGATLMCYQMISEAGARWRPSPFHRKESKGPAAPIGDAGHLRFVPAKQIGVEFLGIVGEVYGEDHMLDL